MRRFGTNILALAAAIILTLFAAACGVTETGNPCPGPGCPIGGQPAEPDSPEMADADIYMNTTYGVTVSYPVGWSVEESAGGDEATFTGGQLGSNATMTFSILDPEPVSLAVYLAQEYPTRTFWPYSTEVLAGFVYDDLAIGPNGGDLMEYFFLMDDVLIHVTAEIFAEDESAFESLLDGIDSL